MALKNLSTAIKTLVDLVLPPRCPVSGDVVEKQGMLSGEAWAALEFMAPPLCDICGIPFEYDTEEAVCGACLAAPPCYARARAALKYNDTSRDLVMGFKHADKLYAVKTFTPLLKRAGVDVLERAEILVPVPLHFWRLMKRRYNQSVLIARDLGRNCGLPVLSDALVRTRATPPQAHLKADKRRKNVRGAFAVKPARVAAIQGKSVLLIDDVLTTGATAEECTKALLEAGAARVDVLAVARAVRE